VSHYTALPDPAKISEGYRQPHGGGGFDRPYVSDTLDVIGCGSS